VSSEEESVRERILLAAGRCLTENGVRDVSLQVIAREAGLARATLYRHFPDGRDQLVNELVTFEVQRFFGELYRSVEGLTSLEHVLERGLRFAHHAVAAHYLLQTMLRDDPSMLEPALSSSIETIEHRIAAIFVPFLEAGPRRNAQADFLSRMSIEYISTQGRWDFDNTTQLRHLVRDELLASMSTSPLKIKPATVRPLRAVEDGSLRTRVVNATLEEMASGHYDDFSLTRVMKAAGVSRATLYRAFPGGRDALLSAAVTRESSRFFVAVADAMASAPTMHDSLLAGITNTWSHLTSHAALLGVWKEKPEVILRSLRFDEATKTYFVASSLVQPMLSQWLEAEEAGRLAEWLCRIVVSYWTNPADYLDITDPKSIALFYANHVAASVERLAKLSS
jgi:AcrR family transcriptional regulator